MWAWCISGMELTRKTEVLRKTRQNATLFTTNPSWTSLGSKAGSEARDRPLRSWSGQQDCFSIFSAWRMQYLAEGVAFSNLCPWHGSCWEYCIAYKVYIVRELLSPLSPQYSLPSMIEEFEVPISSLCSDPALCEDISRQMTGFLSWNIDSFSLNTVI